VVWLARVDPLLVGWALLGCLEEKEFARDEDVDVTVGCLGIVGGHFYIERKFIFDPQPSQTFRVIDGFPATYNISV
jgi:hypothetical protein